MTPLTERYREGLPRLPTAMVPSDAVTALAVRPWHPIVVLQAARGFGKTSSAAWLVRHHGPRDVVVWLSVPDRELTASEFWDLLQRRMSERRLDTRDWTTLDRYLAASDRQLLIAVDDLCRAPDLVDDQLADLVRPHHRISLLATCRAPRRLQGMALTMDGRVLHGKDLSLNAQQVLEMAGVLGVSLTTEQAQTMVQRVSGWPGLLRRALADPTFDPDGPIRTEVVRDLVQRRLADMPAALTAVVSALAVPRHLDLELAHALVGRQSYGELVAWLRADGGVWPIRPEVPSFGEPIRQTIVHTLRTDDPQRHRQVNATVGYWYADRGRAALALQHLIAAADVDGVVKVLHEDLPSLLTNHPALVAQATEFLPAERLAAEPELRIARDFMVDPFVERQAQWAYDSGLLDPRKGHPHGRLTTRPLLIQHRGVVLSGGDVRRLGPPSDPTKLSPALLAAAPKVLLGWATEALLAGRAITASYGFAQAAEWAKRADQSEMCPDAAAGAALSHAIAGNPSVATAWLEQAGTARPHWSAVARAVVSHDQVRPPGDLDDLDLHQVGDLAAVVMAVHCEVLVADGQPARAVHHLAQFRVTDAAGLAGATLVGALVKAHLATGDLERARQTLIETDPDGQTQVALWALLDFQSGEFQRVLDRTHDAPMIPRELLTLELVQAAAAYRLEHYGAAENRFQGAVSIAAQTGLRRPFTLIPAADLSGLLSWMRLADILPDGPSAIAALLPEPQTGIGLSPRELDVLRAAATGASFPAVARRMYVSPNTVKSQMRGIYDKLGVRGRDQAVSRAQELGLLGRPDITATHHHHDAV